MSPVEQLAIQTCYTRARFIAAHLRKYFDDAEKMPELPRELLDSADELVRVLGVHIPKPLPEPREFIEGYDDVPDEDRSRER